MSTPTQQIDLLNPFPALQGHYIHQLKQTIHAYSATQIVIGEVLQNAIDSLVEAGRPNGLIEVTLDFDARTVTVRDNGTGFPNDPHLLFLGGGRKRGGSKKLFGLVGVGLKVVLFSSDFFQIRARNQSGAFRYTLDNAYHFETDPPPVLAAPGRFPDDDKPLDHVGTEIVYRFPAGTSRDPLKEFTQELIERCLTGSALDKGFGKSLTASVKSGVADTRFSALLEGFFRRYTYSADVLNRLGEKPELKSAKITIDYSCSKPADAIPTAAPLFDGKTKGRATIDPSYLLVDDMIGRLPVHEKPGLFKHELGAGGQNLTRTWKGFNFKVYSGPEDYEKLLIAKSGALPDAIEEYRSKLFPRLNGIILTIGRIPMFEEMLPGSSQRMLSSNGVITTHDLEITKGRNQEYVRCFDMVIDVNAELNYGKSQIKDHTLVGLVKRFLNDAYGATIQAAAGNWVGRVVLPDETEERDVFLTRPDLGLDGFVLQKEPTDENDVIALFFELAGKGRFPDFRLFGMSQWDKYDSRGAVRRVGESDPPATPRDDSQALTVEFKVEAAAVIDDFEKEAKTAKDIQLLIAWREGKNTSEHYGFSDIQHSRFAPKKIFPSVQRYLLDTKSGAEVQVLLLEPIVQTLRAAAGPPATSPAAAPPTKGRGKRK